MHLIICIDCDNVLCNLQEAVIKIFNERYNKSYKLEDFNRYSISECINKEDAMNMKSIYGESDIYDYVIPLQNAQTVIQKLMRDGHDVYIVTDAVPSNFAEKINWIKFYFGIDQSHIVSMKHKWLFKCDVLIEDNLDTLLNGYHYERICFNYPWNQNVHDDVYGIYRVHNWKDALNAVNKINKKME